MFTAEPSRAGVSNLVRTEFSSLARKTLTQIIGYGSGSGSSETGGLLLRQLGVRRLPDLQVEGEPAASLAVKARR